MPRVFHSTYFFSGSFIVLLFFAVAMFAPSGESYAQTRTSQNQKRLQGDQAKSNRKKLRETRQKVRSRKGDRAFRGDITGRRVQTKSTPTRRSASIRSTASQSPRYSQPTRRWSNQGVARTSPSTTASKPWRGDITGRRLRTRSASSVRRSPVFRSGPSYLSQKPYSETRSARRATRLQSTPRTASSLGERPWKRGRKIVARTPYGAYGYSRKIPDRSPGRAEKAYRGDITGRRVTIKRSPPRAVATYKTDPRYSRRKPGDQPYTGRAAGDHRTATRRGEAGWQGDITGRRLRQNYTGGKTRRGDQAGVPTGRRTQLSASGRITRTYQRSLPQKSPGVGTQQATRFQGQFRKHELKPSFGADVGKHTGSIKARRPQTGGGSISAKIWGRPKRGLPQKSQGVGTQQATRFQGQFRRHELKPSFGADVGKHTGSIKARRPQTGGGSISAKIWGRPKRGLPQKSQGIGTQQATQFQGQFRRHELKPSYGADVGKHTGSIKARRPQTGGGSISAKIWGKPKRGLPQKSQGIGTQQATQFQGQFRKHELKPSFGADVGKYTGSIKARRPQTGGGSISAKIWGKPKRGLPQKSQGVGTQQATQFQGQFRKHELKPSYGADVGKYTGSIKARRPQTGGGSISAKIWGKQQGGLPQKTQGIGTKQATQYRGFHRMQDLKPSYGADVGKYTGSIKARRPQTGGGSISAKIWGKQQGGLPQKTQGLGTKQATQYRGFHRMQDLKPSYGADVGKYTGSIKARRAPTGGGSISAKIWGKPQRGLPQKTQGLGTKQATQYKGFHRRHDLKPSYGADVGKYSGSIKARRGPTGGGSISAKIWGKPGTALPKKSPVNDALSATQFRGNIKRGELVRGIAKDVGTYQGNLKARRVRPPGKFEGSEHRGSHYSFELKPGMEGDAPYYRGDRKQPRYVKSPNAASGALKSTGIGKADRQMGKFQGNSRLQGNIKMNPNSDKGALAGRAPNRSAVKSAQYQGNMKMKKTQDGRMYPSYHYMANRPVNAKNEKEKFFSFRLLWVKLFKNTSEDPDHLKEPERRPRYDKRESGIWYD